MSAEWTVKVLISLRRCIGWFGISLSAYIRRDIVAWHGPYGVECTDVYVLQSTYHNNPRCWDRQDWANYVDPDQMLHSAASDPGLLSLTLLQQCFKTNQQVIVWTSSYSRTCIPVVRNEGVQILLCFSSSCCFWHLSECQFLFGALHKEINLQTFAMISCMTICHDLCTKSIILVTVFKSANIFTFWKRMQII